LLVPGRAIHGWTGGAWKKYTRVIKMLIVEINGLYEAQNLMLLLFMNKIVTECSCEGGPYDTASSTGSCKGGMLNESGA
jgi:hypothetical protein